MQAAYLESPGLLDFNEIEPGTLTGQKRASDFPDLELHIILNLSPLQDPYVVLILSHLASHWIRICMGHSKL